MSVKDLMEKKTTTGRGKKAPAQEVAEAAPALDTSEFAAILSELRKPVPEELIKEREGFTDRGGRVHMVKYVEWHTVADILDNTCPDWSHRITDIREVGDGGLAVVVELEIAGVTRQGMGVGAIDSAMGVKKAEHDALKRAAVKFGIGRELYHKEAAAEEAEGEYQSRQRYSGGGQQQYTGGQQQQPQGFPANPVAQNLAEMVTTKQLGMIRAVAREANVDADAECMDTMNCRISELSRRAASALIDHLRELGAGGNGFPKAGNQTQPAASTKQQTVSKPPQQLINVVRILLNKLAIPEADAAKDVSGGRAGSLDTLTTEEITKLKDELESA